MTTVGKLVDRIFLDYLESPTNLPVLVQLSAGIDASTTTVVYLDELAPEEVDMMGVGAVIEIGIEPMRVAAHNEGTRTLTVRDRSVGLFGGTAAAHAATDLIRAGTKPLRLSVFNAVCDAIEGLSPELYAVGTEWVTPGEGAVPIDTTENIISILSATQEVGGDYVPVDAEIVRSDDVATGVGVQVHPVSELDVWVRYSKGFARPTSEADTLASLGIEESWYPVIAFDVLANLIPETDLDAATVEFITESLATQGFTPTTGASLAVTFTRLREFQITKAANRLRAVNPARVAFAKEL